MTGDIRKENKAGENRAAAISEGRPAVSMFALYACGSLYRVLAVLAGMILAEGISFYAVCRRLERSGTMAYPEQMIELCLLKYIFLTALVLVAFLLIVTEGDRGGCRSSYTLFRLKVSRKQQFVVKTVYNFLCLMMVFAVQILAALVICRLYAERLPAELVSPQYLFLVFYRSEFLHCILPMADVEKWVCVFLLLLALAMDAAYGGNRNGQGRRGSDGNGSGNQNRSEGLGRKKGVGANVTNGVVLSLANYCILSQWFVSEIHSPLTMLCILYCVVIVAAVLLRLSGVLGGGRDEEI